MTEEEIKQLQQQLREKAEEIKVIYNKLVEAGVEVLPDDILDSIGGGQIVPTEFKFTTISFTDTSKTRY